MVNLKQAALTILTVGMANFIHAVAYADLPSSELQSTASHGFYAGIGVGGLSFANQVNTSGSMALDGFVSASGNSKADTGNIGVNSVLLAGYGWTFPNKIFLSGEVFGDLTHTGSSTNLTTTLNNNFNAETTENTGNVGLTLQSVYGVRALPGYQVTPSSVVYGIVGYARGRAESSLSGSNAISIDNGESISMSVSGSGSDHFDLNGLQLGLGSMIHVTPHIAIRGDLIYTGYEDITLASGAMESAIASAQGSETANPSSLEADVALVYMFD